MAEQQMDVDLENRDASGNAAYIETAFEHSFAEPNGGPQSMPCVWKFSYMCYTAGRNCCYKFITALCGICIALYWGCTMACIAFNHVWCYNPYYAAMKIECHAMRRFHALILACCVEPCCEAGALCFSRITVKNS